MSGRGIALFDIDDTLVPSVSSSSFLAEHFGHKDTLDAAERRYAAGELTNEEVSIIDAQGWSGTPTHAVAERLEGLPLTAGIDAVVAWCTEHDVEPVLASLAWQPVSGAIARRHGFTVNGGPRVHVVGTVHGGTVAEHFNEYDKRDRALQLAAYRGISTANCCAIGDSRSDIPLFDALPASLALTPIARHGLPRPPPSTPTTCAMRSLGSKNGRAA